MCTRKSGAALPEAVSVGRSADGVVAICALVPAAAASIAASVVVHTHKAWVALPGAVLAGYGVNNVVVVCALVPMAAVSIAASVVVPNGCSASSSDTTNRLGVGNVFVHALVCRSR